MSQTGDHGLSPGRHAVAHAAYDVVVAGSGPAGSTAAVMLARAGARVLLIDRDRFPRDKACGDLVGPRGVTLLRRLGLTPTSALRVGDVEVVAPSGRSIALPWPVRGTYAGHAPPQLIVLDLMLPDVVGEEIAARVRERSDVPILMLTAKAGEEQRLAGFQLGADDYLAKPFSPRELVARVKAILRRAGEGDAPLSALSRFDEGRLRIDELRHEVLLDGAPVDLTPTEFRLLARSRVLAL